MVLPAVAVVGAAVIVGRGLGVPSALSRYGGVKISPSKRLVGQEPHSPPPPEKTRPSGRSSATLWYVRGTACGARGVKVFVTGSQSSGVRTDVSSEKGTGKFWPPTTITLPSGRTTEL